PQVAEIRDRLGTRQPVVHVELARQVADAAMNRDGIGGRLDAEDLGAPGGRSDEVEQDPHRRGLAGAVRPEEPEDLALCDLEVEVGDPAMLAVRLRQALGLDDCSHWPSAPSIGCVNASRAPGAPPGPTPGRTAAIDRSGR